MNALPEHVEVVVRTTTTYRCTRCVSCLTPGIYKRKGYGEQLLAEWIEFHRHGVTQPAPPTEGIQP